MYPTPSTAIVNIEKEKSHSIKKTLSGTESNVQNTFLSTNVFENAMKSAFSVVDPQVVSMVVGSLGHDAKGPWR